MDTITQLTFDPIEEELKSYVPMDLDFSNTTGDILSLVRTLRRAIKLKSRISALTIAFQLGELLNQSTISANFSSKNQIPQHYQVIADYVYDIFEPDPTQILQTTSINVQAI